MEEYALIAGRLFCTLDGLSGIVLNIFLLSALLQRSSSVLSNSNVHRIPIFVSSIQGILLCCLIATMNFVHIFRDGTFICAYFGVLVSHMPFIRIHCVLIFQLALALASLMFNLIPATATLQYIALKRSHWSPMKRLLTSFTFTLVNVTYVWVSGVQCSKIASPSLHFAHSLVNSTELNTMFSSIAQIVGYQFAATPQFNDYMDRITRELYRINASQPIVAVGSTARSELNDGRGIMVPIIGLPGIAYSSSYAFFIIMVYKVRKHLSIHKDSLSERTLAMQRALYRMQIMQGFLPLAIVSIPVVVVIIGGILRVNLDFATLIFTIFLWFCPVVQALVQLRFVRQSNAKTSEAIPSISISRTTNKKKQQQRQFY